MAKNKSKVKVAYCDVCERRRPVKKMIHTLAFSEEFDGIDRPLLVKRTYIRLCKPCHSVGVERYPEMQLRKEW